MFVYFVSALVMICSVTGYNFKLFSNILPTRQSYESALRKAASSISVGVVLCTTTIGPYVALANVGEGGLPDGAMAFSKLIKYQV